MTPDATAGRTARTWPWSSRVRPSPLGFRHVNFLGRYVFTLPEPGRLRPLRDPEAADDEEDEAVA